MSNHHSSTYGDYNGSISFNSEINNKQGDRFKIISNRFRRNLRNEMVGFGTGWQKVQQSKNTGHI